MKKRGWKLHEKKEEKGGIRGWVKKKKTNTGVQTDISFGSAGTQGEEEKVRLKSHMKKEGKKVKKKNWKSEAQ